MGRPPAEIYKREIYGVRSIMNPQGGGAGEERPRASRCALLFSPGHLFDSIVYFRRMKNKGTTGKLARDSGDTSVRPRCTHPKEKEEISDRS